ncbi:hypothetical protein LTR62_002163 [Meristemomyces frigidus]|uniref:4'-phosphopantetheinyl transferase domain-containing protein n=1 Tax=Meristemomyces frigidus TaxID=1508187 RepID=A0AAN7YAW6_9PEZI|nr:hypothetical protein LTR62_002163 [Meristemomyces frigidus]
MPPRPFPFPLGIGTDICNTRRIRHILLKDQNKITSPGEQTNTTSLHRFLRGFLSWREQQLFWKIFHNKPEHVYEDLPRAVRYLGGRWAAKEAVIKAVAHRRLNFQHIQILPSLSRTGPIYALILDKPASAYNRTVQQAEAQNKDTHHSGGDMDPTFQDVVDYNLGRRPKGRNGFSRSVSTESQDSSEDFIPGELQDDSVDGQVAKISVSHDGDYATAVCLAVEEPRQGDVGGEAAAREP